MAVTSPPWAPCCCIHWLYFPLSSCKFPRHEASRCRQCRELNAQTCDSGYSRDKGEDRALPPHSSLLSELPCSSAPLQHPLPASPWQYVHVQGQPGKSWCLGGELIGVFPSEVPLLLSLVQRGGVCQSHCCPHSVRALLTKPVSVLPRWLCCAADTRGKCARLALRAAADGRRQKG